MNASHTLTKVDKEHLVIIGAGMAAIKLCDCLSQGHHPFRISLINEEKELSYNRIMLSPVLAGEKSFDDITLHDANWYEEHSIELLNDCQVTSVDIQNKSISLSSGIQIHYDKLVFATGSLPFMVPIPGYKTEGVIPFRTKADVDIMLKALAEPKPDENTQKHVNKTSLTKQCIVLGGGLLGLEAANALNQQGANVTVIHRDSHLLNRQLNPQAAQLLQENFEKRGIQFFINSEIQEIYSKNAKVDHVVLKSGETLPCDIIVMAVGVLPNKQLAEQSTLTCERGISVDPQMRTSQPDIYAIGECAQVGQEVIGLVAPAYEHAKVLAEQLLGKLTSNYESKATATKLKVSGIDLFSAGEIDVQDDCEVLDYEDFTHGVYKQLLIKDNILQGAILYGDVLDGNWYFDLIQQQEDIRQHRDHLLFGKAFCT